FGLERALGGRHAMAQVVEWLGDPAYWVDDLVTHVHPLEQWTQALATAAAGPAARCVKATLRPNPDVPLVGDVPLASAPHGVGDVPPVGGPVDKGGDASTSGEPSAGAAP
ncbi:MAG TPA: hypothetical protein VF143_01725, partial [Candidatus Nanopelagicales bacterium]